MIVFSKTVKAVAILLLVTPPTTTAVLVRITDFSRAPVRGDGDPNDPIDVTECNGAAQTGLVYRNSETEPYIAVNPTDPENMIAGWHVDRWSNGGGQAVGTAYTMDGGETWTQVKIPFTRCYGAEEGDPGDFERASDPWISFSPDGRAHYQALVFDDSAGENGILTSYSDDGGETWSVPVRATYSPAQDKNLVSPFADKNALTADPHDPNLVYSVWTQFRGFKFNPYPIYFSRSTDGGESWENPKKISNHKKVENPAKFSYFYQGNQIVVLPDGTLVNAFYREIFDYKTKESYLDQAILRSFDKGESWEKEDTVVSEVIGIGTDLDAYAIDPELLVPVRDAGAIPDIAVNKITGDLYMVWQNGNPDTGLVDVVISRSGDGGDTWIDPLPLGMTGVQTFLPSVSVAGDDTVGVMFYDFRNDIPGDDELHTDVFLKRFQADLTFIDEIRLTDESFDMRQMVIARGYFPGDYVGLDAAGNDFVAAFTISNPLGLDVEFPPDGLEVDNNNRQDIVFTRVPGM